MELLLFSPMAPATEQDPAAKKNKNTNPPKPLAALAFKSCPAVVRNYPPEPRRCSEEAEVPSSQLLNSSCGAL